MNLLQNYTTVIAHCVLVEELQLICLIAASACSGAERQGLSDGIMNLSIPNSRISFDNPATTAHSVLFLFWLHVQ
jgi:hypothetical protein